MGLMDFFKRGKEEPVEKKSVAPTPAGTTARQGAPQSPGQTTQRDYTIQSGDSLSKIAKKFYGDASAWQKIYQANQDKIKNPDMIYPGQKIIIP